MAIIASTNVVDRGDIILNTVSGTVDNLNKVYLQRQNAGQALGSDLTVDIIDTGSHTFPLGDVGGTISAGTGVEVYLITFDASSRGGTRITVSFSVTFEEGVLGLITSEDNLGASDSYFGLSYGSSVEERGLESGDEITLSSDRKTLSGTLTIGSAPKLDHLRIIISKDAADIFNTSKASKLAAFNAWDEARRLVGVPAGDYTLRARELDQRRFATLVVGLNEALAAGVMQTSDTVTIWDAALEAQTPTIANFKLAMIQYLVACQLIENQSANYLAQIQAASTQAELDAITWT